MKLHFLIIAWALSLTYNANGQTRFSKLKGCEFGKRINVGFMRKLIPITDSFPGKTLTIQVIFHVIYSNQAENISTANIIQELNDLDRDYMKMNKDTESVYPLYAKRIGNPNIHFQLADTAFDGSADLGIRRIQGNSNRDLYRVDPVIGPDRYLNIYTGRINSDGFTYTNPWVNPKTDAIFLYYAWVGGSYRLLSHETGHWLGLYHIFEGGCSAENDGITDTPPQRRSTGMGHTCGFDPSNQCSGSTVPMFNNYMDYSDCRVMFTNEQANVMRQNLLTYRQNVYK